MLRREIAETISSSSILPYICHMSTVNVEILNPKAKKLLQDMEDLKLISIKGPSDNPFLAVIKRIRSRNAKLSLSEISKEVEIVRAKRYGKKP